MRILGFDYPDDCHFCLQRDLWVRALDAGGLRLGVTPFGVRISGHFFMCRPKAVGTRLAVGDTMAVVELNKSVVTVRTPVAGVVRAVNPRLATAPEVIEEDPYGKGWLVELTPEDWARDRTRLHHGAHLPPAAQARMRLENLDFSDAP